VARSGSQLRLVSLHSCSLGPSPLSTTMARSAAKLQLAVQLLAYIRQRNEAGVERTLAAGASVDGSSELDWRPIIAAAASGKV
ncbi:unnamed protein product, partial [Ectocarpus sp. 12 AP-2014]